MNDKQHRAGVTEANLVVRHLKLEEKESLSIENLVSEIDEIMGLDSVSYDADTNTLHVAYDASKVCLDCIEEVLDKHKVSISHDWWTHFKEGYYRFVDDNVKDNAKREPWSCHKPPSRR